MRETGSHLFADISRMKHAMTTADVHLIHLAVGWFNGHRAKGSEPIKAPDLYQQAVDELQVTDDDMAAATALLSTFSAMPD